MGTNYYVIENYCDHCKRGDQRHIGKSSAGWTFGLRVYPEDGIHEWDDWERVLGGQRIVNEYGDVVTLDALRTVVTKREGRKHSPNDDERWYRDNGAERGPNGLARRVEGARYDRWTRHGKGTYDLCNYEFS